MRVRCARVTRDAALWPLSALPPCQEPWDFQRYYTGYPSGIERTVITHNTVRGLRDLGYDVDDIFRSVVGQQPDAIP